jgi:hypothetical protein
MDVSIVYKDGQLVSKFRLGGGEMKAREVSGAGLFRGVTHLTLQPATKGDILAPTVLTAATPQRTFTITLPRLAYADFMDKLNISHGSRHSSTSAVSVKAKNTRGDEAPDPAWFEYASLVAGGVVVVALAAGAFALLSRNRRGGTGSHLVTG